MGSGSREADMIVFAYNRMKLDSEYKNLYINE